MRNKFALIIGLVINIIFAILFGLIYSVKNTGYQFVQSRIGLLFFIGLNQMFGNVTAMLNVFSVEKVIINKEQ
jgi:hypothetical protein